MASSDDRPISGEGEPSPDDEDRDRVTGVRESIARRLAEIEVEAEQSLADEQAAALTRVEERTNERIEAMFAGFAKRIDQDLAEAANRAGTEAREAAESQLRVVVESLRTELTEHFTEKTDARLNVIDRSLSARAAAATIEAAARLRQELDTSFAEWRIEAQAEVGDATREAAIALVEQRTASARKALGKQNEAAIDTALMSVKEQALREVKRRSAKLEKRMRSEVGDRMAAAESKLARSAAKGQAELAAELQDEIDARLNAARTDVVTRVDGATAKLHERVVAQAATRIADHTSSLIEQAAKNSASLSERAAELAAESRRAAEEVAREVAGEESHRLYSELGPRLEARIEAAETASAEAAARARSELEDVNAEAARKRLDEAIERVRAEGASQLAKVTDAAHKELSAYAEDLEKREHRRELKLAKAETSRRVKRALSGLDKERDRIDSEREAAAKKMRAELDEATSQAMTRIDGYAEDAGREVAGGGERLADALRRVEETVAEVEESTGRISELERRAGVAEQQAARSAAMARNAVELETRMREALTLEAAAAEQIAIAERRLIDFVVHR